MRGSHGATPEARSRSSIVHPLHPIARALAIAVMATCAACGAPTQGAARRPDVGRGSESAPRSIPASAASQRTSEDPPPAFAHVVELARTRLTGADMPARLSEEDAGVLSALTYDQVRALRFRTERALWRGEPGRFEVQLFHLGHVHLTPIALHVIEGERDEAFAYDPSLFRVDDPGVRLPESPSLGYAGFRLHAPVESDTYRDEFLVFLGASTFRARARGQVYGLSARGLAIDTGLERPEEFPRFSRFWLVRPAESDRSAWILALLESARATGAYAFRVTPGAPTTIEVHARVFFRERPEVVGVAPLTSMYLFGEDRPARFGDFRPEVHDSDTLVIHTSDGEQLARPLRNPPRTAVSRFRVEHGLRGFGLAQRDRDFRAYQDLESSYERRPSAWIEPLGAWGSGEVRLLEIATELETDDNLAAMWVPDVIPDDGLDLHYRVSMLDTEPRPGDGARVVATRVSLGERFAGADADLVRFVVDLAGPAIDEPSALEAAAWRVDARGADVMETRVATLPAGGARAVVALRAPPGVDEIELRGFLARGDEALSETWSYRWQRSAR